MNMFARFDENPAMTLRVIKEQNVTDGRTHGQRENSIPPYKVCGGYNYASWPKWPPPRGSHVLHRLILGKHDKNSCLKPQT